MTNAQRKSNCVTHLAKINLRVTEEFLRLLDPEADEFTFQIYDDLPAESKAKGGKGKKRSGRIIRGAWGKHRHELEELNNNGYAVAVAINETDGEGRKKENVTRIRAIKADFDGTTPPEQWPLKPSIIVTTREGRYHYYWLVEGKMSKKTAEGIEKCLVKKYGADPACAEIARAMRLPGFLHQKEAPSLVRIAESNGKRYKPNELKRAFPPAKAKPRKSSWGAAGTEQINKALTHVEADIGYHEWLKIGMALHDHFGGSDEGLQLWDEWSSTGKKYEAGLCEKKWKSFGRLQGIRIATLFHLAREGGYKPDGIEDLNAEFAFIRGMGIVYQDGGEDKFMPVEKFNQWVANRSVNGTNWLKDEGRRDYDRVVFRPGSLVGPRDYNLWQGWKVLPAKKGSCNLFLDHLRDNVTQGNKAHYRWLMSFLADIFQNPLEPKGVSPVILGKSGAGKTAPMSIVGHLLGSHYMLVDDPKQVTGRFNGHMARLLLLHADESTFLDKREHGKLRSIITRKDQFIELKGLEGFTVPNCMRLVITTEEEAAVAATLQERRFAIFECGDGARGDTAFWKEMHKQMENGGYERLLHKLLHWKICDLRELPQTEGLMESKLRNLSSPMKWWHNRLVTGDLISLGWPRKVKTETVFQSYAQGVGGDPGRSIETECGKFLKKVMPQGFDKKRDWYRIPSLKNCRSHFTKETGITFSD
jgi:hypothetical protein